ncbi:MAG: class I SAM-dependent RNA methyltransferase [Bdellovibrionaceae bacterium]|nr:class I SAM-dependent RNA methyltransferase [Pseudobdellovibrionaceae bacterium]
MEKEFHGTITDISSEGLGVVRHPNGMTVFVSDAWPGDAGEFVIERTEKRFAFAKWKQQTTFSPDRVTAPCPHLGFSSGQCGGCPWMDISYEAQLREKQKYLEGLFKRYRIESKIHKIQGSPLQFGFRNRAQVKTDGEVVGYVSPKTRQMAPIKDCIILEDKVRDILRFVVKQLPNQEWKPAGKYQWNFIDIDHNLNPSDVMINKRRPFQQANPNVNQYMRQWVEEKLQTNAFGDMAVELFCGSGNFTEILAKFFKTTIASELPGSALAQLHKKSLAGVKTKPMDLFDSSQWPDLIKECSKAKFLFLDPPREGFRFLSHFVQQLPELETIMYVSCDPYTFVNNVRVLIDESWSLLEVQPVDQFPHTPHVELLAVLEKVL